ncbi:hypothetical protein SPSYN_01031 [Sporotomaculum syntrophicum]|uniref:Uncharacterized protein n=1 Tax=Sporotomaculum syntrophicum TaxID=182264 RepID=A0A9D2WSH5_9FIRM|nr:hypothetical protein SPSYN_01031 [Sporotomaculum syntrophicum]
MADKYSDLWFLSRYISFRRVYPFCGQVAASVVEEFTALGARSAGAENRFRDVYRALEGSADKDSGSGGLHGIGETDLGKIMTG